MHQKSHTVALFLSTPSARRATMAQAMGAELIVFLSTPSARRATQDDDGNGTLRDRKSVV